MAICQGEKELRNIAEKAETLNLLWRVAIDTSVSLQALKMPKQATQAKRHSRRQSWGTFRLFSSFDSTSHVPACSVSYLSGSGTGSNYYHFTTTRYDMHTSPKKNPFFLELSCRYKSI
jgi:hypothetical protein